MSIEDRLSESLARTLDQLEVPAGDVGAALHAGERQRRQRTWTTGLAAAAALAVVATGVAVARSGDDGNGRLDPAPDAPSWTRLPEAPLSPRAGGIAVWTGTEAIFLGGQIDHFCPPSADCADAPTYAKDGAAYDPVSQAWRTIAPSPIPVAAHTRHAMLGDELVLVGDDGSWWTYDASDDQWRDLPAQPDARSYAALSAFDGKVYALREDDVVQVFELHSEKWSTLPASPIRPRLEAHSVVATPEGIVVTGQDSTALLDGTVPMWAFAEVYDGTSWQRLERTDMVGGYLWHWTGKRLVAPDLGCIDGGEVNPYPSCIPQGGTLDLRTGTWAELVNAPGAGSGGWSRSTAGWSLFAADGPLMTTYGYFYDDSAGTWTELTRPGGAPDYAVAGVWADGTLIVFGGIDSEQGWDKDALSNRAWSWTP